MIKTYMSQRHDFITPRRKWYDTAAVRGDMVYDYTLTRVEDSVLDDISSEVQLHLTEEEKHSTSKVLNVYIPDIVDHLVSIKNL